MTVDHPSRLIFTEFFFPFASTFSEKDIRLLSIPVRSPSNADLANMIAWSKFSAGGTYTIRLFKRYVIISAGVGDWRLVKVRMVNDQCAEEWL